MFNKQEKTIFYLRTDLGAQDLKAGGSVAHTLGVIGGFKNMGYQIVCASSAMIDLLSRQELKAFLPISMPKRLFILGFRLNCLLSNFFFTFKSWQFLKHKNIDFVYQRYSLLSVSGLLIAWIKKAPFILEFNGSELWIDKYWLSKDWMRVRFLIRWIENINLKKAHSIIVVSQVLKDQLVEQGIDQSKILVNPNGVDTDVFDPAKLVSERIEIRKKNNLEDKFVFGFIGTFSVWHGVDVLAQMIPRVCKQMVNVHFLLIGDGPLFNYFCDELKKAGLDKTVVTVTGTIDQYEAKNYLSACDAFLSPTNRNTDGSRFFGSPTKMFEYMALGKPIIASDLEQLTDLLSPAFYLLDDWQMQKNNKIGILIKPGDIDGFAQAACRLVNLSDEQRQAIGQQVRSKTVNQYSWDEHTKKIIYFVRR